MTSHSIDHIKIPTALWRDLPKLGIKDYDVIRKASLPLTVLTEPVVVNTAQYFAIWQAISELIGDAASRITKLMTDVE